jgi:hypothetical protein
VISATINEHIKGSCSLPGKSFGNLIESGSGSFLYWYLVFVGVRVESLLRSCEESLSPGRDENGLLDAMSRLDGEDENKVEVCFVGWGDSSPEQRFSAAPTVTRGHPPLLQSNFCWLTYSFLLLRLGKSYAVSHRGSNGGESMEDRSRRDVKGTATGVNNQKCILVNRCLLKHFLSQGRRGREDGSEDVEAGGECVGVSRRSCVQSCKFRLRLRLRCSTPTPF